MLRIASLWALGSLLLILAFPDTGAATPVVVYDNTTTPTSGSYYAPDGDGFLPFNFYASNEPMGDQISLAGTDRVVTEFDLFCSSTQETTLAALTLSFYALDGDGGFPKTQIWSDTVNNLIVDGITTVVFSVSDYVVVPDTFLWVVSADSSTAGLATYNPPMVGSSGNYFWDLNSTDGEWYPLYLENDPVANFGARVMAIPDPATSVLLVVGGLFMAWRKRY